MLVIHTWKCQVRRLFTLCGYRFIYTRMLFPFKYFWNPNGRLSMNNEAKRSGAII